MCYVEIYSTPGFKLNITPMYTAQQYIKSKCWWRPDFKIATLKVTFKLKYSLTVRESDPWLVVRVDSAAVVVGGGASSLLQLPVGQETAVGLCLW